MDQWWHIQSEGDLRSTFEKADSATVLAHHHVHHFMDKNKHQTLLSQCKLEFTERNVLMAENPARETIPGSLHSPSCTLW
jgi:hypothetical protein